MTCIETGDSVVQITMNRKSFMDISNTISSRGLNILHRWPRGARGHLSKACTGKNPSRSTVTPTALKQAAPKEVVWPEMYGHPRWL